MKDMSTDPLLPLFIKQQGRAIRTALWRSTSVGLFLSCLLLAKGAQPALSEEAACRLGPTSSITSTDQAKCLLREPKMFGGVGPRLTSLPPPLQRLMALSTIDISKDQFRRYIASKNIQESEIGGSLDRLISRTNNNDPSSESARYFIIHDTSTPNLGAASFPADINESSWRFNDFSRYGSGPQSPAHIIISRLGQSVTRIDFGQPWRSTAFESDRVCGINRCKGLFVAVELVQPRRCKGTDAVCRLPNPANDAIAPDPGFTNSQLERLAVVYVAASLRRGKWLIPAFHVSLDQVVGSHDDPQNFRLADWAHQLDAVITAVNAAGARP